MRTMVSINGSNFATSKLSANAENGYLSYLQGDGNSYIFVDGWSGYRANANDIAGTIPSDAPRIEVGIVGIPSTVGENVIIGTIEDVNKNMMPCIYTINNDFKIRSQGKGASSVNGVQIADADRGDDILHSVIFGSVKSYIDGVEVVDNSNMANQYRLSAYERTGLAIFGGLYSDVFTMSPARIQYVKFYNGETLVRDLRAYLKDSTPCMKDEVSNTFFYNQGQGAFRVGEILEG